ncbi:ribonuclease H [Punctularia strigosozonata HHB-11173 SS5]|uniref:ribonuclease H n=1 Tax=Punctularia strigosozonata (strain HHB-11173) TaxID=741275 RepID=UPI00044166FD|nr:ribonuclease H [Punctularia strigosozonata HHB-11173 SS5]EIN06988.1 ribonuclease H [Punctularia strigosozonata HHB-11173 SS5]
MADPKKRKISSIGTSDMNGSGNDEWTKVERRKAKKAKKTETKLTTTPPRLLYSTGEMTRRKEAIGISDIRDLVLHMVADAPPPSWLRVENPHSISHVVTLLVPGLTPDLLALPPLPTSATANPNLPLAIPSPSAQSAIPWVASTFSHACPTRAPGDRMRMHSVLAEFFQGPVSGEEKKRRMQVRIAAEREQRKDPTAYLLTREQMVENDYPVPSYIADVFEKPDGWVETPQPAETSTTGVIYGIDCEMCLTDDGKQLARVCIINYATNKVEYDQLVKPEKPVVDYLTRWSGITPAALSTATATFDEVQTHVLSLLSVSPTPILLGHSLESDLKALKIAHPLCIDTALIYHHPRGRPMKPGLAWLTKKWCGRVIQDRGEGGHDPEEDARACMELLRKKVDNGPGYGEFRTDFESIFERISRAPARGGGSSIRSAVVDHGNPAVMHGSKATTVIPCAGDEDVLQGLLSTVPSHAFVFGRFTALADALGCTCTSPLQPGEPSETPASAQSLPNLPDVLSALNTRLKTLYEALPPRTALVIFTGHDDPRKMAALNSRRGAFEEALRAGVAVDDLVEEKKWTAADGRELEAEVERARRGLLFLCVKSPSG